MSKDDKLTWHREQGAAKRRRERLAAELRSNLRRRKEQARSRAERKGAGYDDEAPDTGPEKS
jgi:hypothetical protein